MAATLKGKAIIWGLSLEGTDVTGGGSVAIISSTTAIPQSADFTRTSEKDYLLDSNGDSIGVAYRNHKQRFTITAIPADRTGANSKAAALANMIVCTPDPGDLLDVADAKSAITDALYSGVFVVTASRCRRTNTGAAVIELDVEQVEDNDMSLTPA